MLNSEHQNYRRVEGSLEPWQVRVPRQLKGARPHEHEEQQQEQLRRPRRRRRLQQDQVQRRD